MYSLPVTCAIHMHGFVFFQTVLILIGIHKLVIPCVLVRFYKTKKKKNQNCSILCDNRCFSSCSWVCGSVAWVIEVGFSLLRVDSWLGPDLLPVSTVCSPDWEVAAGRYQGDIFLSGHITGVTDLGPYLSFPSTVHNLNKSMVESRKGRPFLGKRNTVL